VLLWYVRANGWWTFLKCAAELNNQLKPLIFWLTQVVKFGVTVMSGNFRLFLEQARTESKKIQKQNHSQKWEIKYNGRHCQGTAYFCILIPVWFFLHALILLSLRRFAQGANQHPFLLCEFLPEGELEKRAANCILVYWEKLWNFYFIMEKIP
jgi:hypothetical protein